MAAVLGDILYDSLNKTRKAVRKMLADGKLQSGDVIDLSAFPFLSYDQMTAVRDKLIGYTSSTAGGVCPFTFTYLGLPSRTLLRIRVNRRKILWPF